MIANNEIAVSRPMSPLALLERHRGTREEEVLPRRKLALLHAVTHEMRSPLTVIRAYSSTVIDRKAKLSVREIKDLMRRIESSARLVELIVGDLEVLTEQETVALCVGVLDLPSFLSEITTDLRALVPGRDLQLVFSRKRLQLRADSVRLKQVLNNLVENAHKYSKAGGRIVVRVQKLERDVLISVEDEGPGVPAEDVERIFQPFFRGADTSGIEGSGLGLAICKSLVEAQGGSLQAASIPGPGFRVTIALPLPV